MVNTDLKYHNYRIPVPAAYEAVFTHFYFAANKSKTTITKKLLPSFQKIMLFNFGSPTIIHSPQRTEIIVEKCLVLGPIKQAFDYSLLPDSEILVANFKDDAFYRFFGDAAAGVNLPIHPDELLHENCFTALWTVLHGIQDTHEKVDFILEYCKPYLNPQGTIATQLTHISNGNLNPIKVVASKRQQTERHIQQEYKRQFGYTAKEKMRYHRFLIAVERLEEIASHDGSVNWFEIVDDCGYYDQSQLIRDFKYYIGMSPMKYLKFQQDICTAKP
ncbi:hypothetical protein GCM10023231_21060 [Olivibacter ginsenosidimutans]|uniref:HTH araC/xylS-type domain-containing protein n=1 Tax=Olivibacter ginsenosidimutans TaxID=1176537 RepID=A0ABP9BCJ0_9SPHI